MPLDRKTGREGPRASCFVTTITPFDAEGRFDEGATRAHFQRMAKAGIGVYVGTGGSGEGYSLSADETSRLLRIAVAEVGGSAPVRSMGVEPRSAAQMIDFLKLARDAGVEASQVYSLDVGHGHAPTPSELERYYSQVLEAISDLPLIIATHQSVGYRMPAQLIEGLVAKYPQVIGVNCSHQDLGYLASIIDGAGSLVDVHVGGPAQGLTCLAFGGNGFVASEGNLAPHLCMKVVQSYLAGDQAGLLTSFNHLVRLSSALYGNGGIRVTKAILNRFGLAGGFPRLPRLPAEEPEIARALSVIESLDIRQYEPDL